ncbi:MAG: 4-hydroxy-tetrahydrodipicolinate reductase [Deltaproteobacteria bacterium]|nr:4-hydroxy-tetrahydrodipicolinate reductase [Deltaproteobacteria bacterium]
MTRSKQIRVGVAGAAGRMGQMLVREVVGTEGLVLGAATEMAGHAALGRDAAVVAGLEPCGVELSAQPRDLVTHIDVAIDFTTPAHSIDLAKQAAKTGCRLVIGTTGLDETQRTQLQHAAKNTSIVWAPNMSVGVNVLLRLVAEAARLLGPDFDLEIVEAHHKHKVDAPSGTALRIAEVLAEATADRGSLDARACHGREGISPREPAQIGLHSVRGGDVVGDHTVLYCGEGERLELIHRASSRQTFTRGAARAAQWVAHRAPGLYDMQDVLDLRND